MSKYAEKTMVPVERSRHEIERTLQRYGATKFAYGWGNDQGVIQFERVNRHIRFTLPLPYRKDFPDHQAGNGRWVSGEKEWEQACRRAWRALALVIKAKLEAVDAGIVTFEEEFMAQIVLPSGSTVGEFMTPQIERAYETGGMPALLPGEAP